MKWRMVSELQPQVSFSCRLLLFFCRPPKTIPHFFFEKSDFRFSGVSSSLSSEPRFILAKVIGDLKGTSEKILPGVPEGWRSTEEETASTGRQASPKQTEPAAVSRRSSKYAAFGLVPSD